MRLSFGLGADVRAFGGAALVVATGIGLFVAEDAADFFAGAVVGASGEAAVMLGGIELNWKVEAATGITGLVLCPATIQFSGTVKLISEVARSAA